MQNIRCFNMFKKIYFSLFLFTFCYSANAFVKDENYFVDKSVSQSQTLINKLKSSNNIQVFSLFSHGRSGELFLNGEWKNSLQIVQFLKARINNHQTHINIYGCEFAKGLKGLSAVSLIESKLGISVSASNNITGKDGDWNLEVGKNVNVFSIPYYNANLQCTNQGMLPSQDFDCDGIINSIDIDDDNDGILDVLEEPTCYTPIQLDNLTWFNSSSINPGTYTKPGSPLETITSNFPLGGTGSFCGSFNAGGYGPNGQTYMNSTSNSKGWFETLNDFGGTFTFTRTFLVTPGLRTHIKVGMGNVHPAGLQPATISSSIDGHNLGTADRYNSDGYNGIMLIGSYDWVPSGNIITLTISFTASGGCYSDEAIFELLQLYQIPPNDCGQDLDGDGIPNQFDLDSDGDGCPDAREASVSNAYLLAGTIINGVPNVNVSNVPGAIVTGPYGSNGLSSLIETNDTGTAGINYYSTYYNAFSNTISVCRDSDGDGVNDLIDLDDDNDGILDSTEAPTCYYSQAEASKIDLVSTVMIASSNGIRPNWYDNNPTTISDFEVNVSIVNKELYNITPSISPIAVTAVTFDMTSYSMLTSTSTAKLQGFNGITWVDLSVSQNAIVTNGTEIFTNSLHPTTPYLSFRLYGVSGSTNFAYCSEIHLIPTNLYYGSTAPKGICLTDTDGDGIINTLDLDSDGDGCTDSLEAGVSGLLNSGSVVNLAGTTILPNAIAVGPYGDNGLANGVETISESGIINYNSNYISAGISKFLNFCSDTDGDGIGDLVDLDDDNDGVLDSNEAPTCYFTADESSVTTSITSQLSMYSPVNYCFDNVITTYSAFIPSVNWVGQDLFNITPTNPLPIAGVELDLVNWPLSIATSNTFKLQGYNGSIWVDLSAPVYSTATTGKFTISNSLQPNITFQKYKIVGVTGSSYYGGVTELHLVPAISYQASKYPKAICILDTDQDGIINTLDSDSDGDGCSDAKEAGATTNSTANYLFTGPYGANGLADSLETASESGVINYGLNYQFAVNSSLNGCIDSDGDGIGDLIDIDDDNDGILDTVEQSCINPIVSKIGVTASMTLTSSTGGISNLINGTELNDFYYNNQNIAGQTVAQFNFPTSHVLNKLEITTTSGNYFFNAGSTVIVQGWNGSTWIDVSSILTPTASTYTSLSINQSTKFDISLNTNSYSQYRIFGVSGGVNTAGWEYEAYFVEKICTELDTDSDGIINRLDLDSDGDGCPDAKEAGVSGILLSGSVLNGLPNINTSISNAIAQGPYGSNGYANPIESSDTPTGIPTYISTYSPNAISVVLNSCDDTDGDGIADLIDIDDDNDGILDAIEAPSCYYTLAELSQITEINSDLNMMSGFLSNLFDNTTTTVQSFVNQQDIAGKSIYEVITTRPVVISSLNLYEAVSIFVATNKVKLQGWTGLAWTDLSLALTPPAVNASGAIVFTNTINPTIAYAKYRLFGDVTSTGKITAQDCSEIKLSLLTSNYQASKYPKPTCSIDSDGDHINNDKDSDSDNDGCSDAKEVGATINGTVNYAFPGPYGLNGLADVLETTLESGITNYASTYQYAISSAFNSCLDSDNDGVGDITDIDDDNDGILDTAEQSCSTPVVSKVGVIASTSLVVNSPISNLINGADVNDFSYGSGQSIVGQSIVQFVFPVVHILNKFEITTNSSNFLNGTTVKVQGWNGVSWVDVSGVIIPVATTPSNFSTNYSIKFDISTNTKAYSQYRIYGLSSTIGANVIYEAFFAETTCSELDTDGDGISNRLDLDSDGDSCPDSKEAGVSGILISGSVVNGLPNSTTTINNAIAQGPYGINGLANSIESSDTLVGVPNYISAYIPNALSIVLNGCTDTDGDGISDLIDIDDDNDGIIDSVEAPSCYYTATEISIPTSVTTELANGTGTMANLNDNISTTTQSFIAQDIAGKSVFEVTPVTAVAITTLNLLNATTIFISSNKVKLQGWTGSSWIDLSAIATPIAVNTSGIIVFTNTLNPTISYPKYRLFGDVSSTGNINTNLISEITLSPTAYQVSKNPKTTCLVDTDGDHITNDKDLDSDNDGCSDSKETGATTNSTTNYAFPGPYGANGLADTLESVLDIGITNYVSTYQYAISALLNACLDSDGDGVGDLLDIDDDNDGILDIVEQNCASPDVSKLGVTASSTLTFAQGTISNIVNGSEINDFYYSSQSIVGQTVAQFNFPVAHILNKLEITTNGGNFFSTATVKVQGWNGASWADVSAVLSPVNATISSFSIKSSNKFDISGNTNSYTQYRILGITGSVNSGPWVYEAYFSETICNEIDTDSDGISNRLDLDSDGDGCPDSKEAGVSGILLSGNVVNGIPNAIAITANALAQGPYGINGLANPIENSDTSVGVPTYISNYSPNATSNLLNACSDTDGDGIPDLKDIDDDNDGILDAVEAPSCYYTSSEIGIPTSVTSELVNGTGIIANLNDSNATTTQSFIAQDIVGKSIYEVTPAAAVAITTLNLYNVTTIFIASNIVKLQGWTGFNWVNLSVASSPLAVNASGVIVFTNTINPSVAYPKYRLYGDATSTGNINTNLISEITLSPTAYQASKNPKATCLADTDGDHITNDKDLDSDNDGCSDAKESGATTNSLVNYSFPGPYGSNGLADALEATLDSGITNYFSTYQYAISSLLNYCLDSDSDGIVDLIDLDDDNDGVLDSVEQTCISSNVSKLGVTASMTLIAATGSISNLLNGTELNDFWYSGGQSIIGQTVAQFNFPIGHILNRFEITTTGGNFFNAGSTIKVQGWNGLVWVDVSSVLIPVTATASTFSTNVSHKFDISSNTNSYTQYRILGITGTVSGGPDELEAYFTESICTDIDTDGDSIPNRLDLDSDNDGCSDAKEAGATTSNITNYIFPGPYGINGLTNSLETASESGIVNYTLNYSNVVNSLVKSCVILCPTVTNSLINNINPSTCSGSNGIVKLCGLAFSTSGYTINYSKNGTPATALMNQVADANGCITISNLGAGVYSNIIITHALYCTTGTTAVGPITLTAPAGPSIPTVASTTQPSCGVTTGTIVFTTQLGVEYSVDNGLTYQATDTFAGLVAGTYTLKVRSVLDITCVTSALMPVSINTVPSVPDIPTVANTIQPTCVIASGTIVFMNQSGVEYSIDNGITYQSSATFTGLMEGIYYLKVRKIIDFTCITSALNPLIINASPIKTTPNLTVFGAICNGTTYDVSFNSNGIVTASSGIIVGNTITGILVGTDVIVTSTTISECASTQTTFQSPTSCITHPIDCSSPTISAGNGVCSGSGLYSVSVSSSAGSQISANMGTVLGNSVIGIPLGTQVTITATTGICSSSVMVSSPLDCTTPCVTSAVSYSVGNCLGTTYTIYITNPSSAILQASSGILTATAVINIPIGTNVTLSANSTGCTAQIITLSSPVGCVIDAVTETTPSINGTTGGTTPSLILNDTLNNIPVVLGTAQGDVTITPVSVPIGLSLNTNTGVVTIAPNTISGIYPVVYTICEVSNTSNCDTVTSYVVVFVTDFTTTIDIDNVVFSSAGISRDFVVNVSEIETGSSVGQVVFKIFKQSAFIITYSPTTTSSNVSGGTFVNNNDWIISQDALFITGTLKPNIVINTSTFSSIGFTITRNSSIPSQTWQPITTTIVAGTGGDGVDENNTYNILVKAQ